MKKKETQKTEWKKPLLEAVKEPLRLLVLAVVPVLITLAADLPKEYAAVAVLVLRFVDSWVHQIGKETGNKVQVKGLVRF